MYYAQLDTGSHSVGLGSNHGDVQHWSRRYSKTMDNVRNDVAAILAADDTVPSVPAKTEDNAKAIWYRLYAAIQNPYGVAGVMGNFMAESSLRANNLQNSYEKLEEKEKLKEVVGHRGGQPHFLYGKVFCGECGAPMTRRTVNDPGGGKIKTWIFREKRKGSGCECRNVKEEELLKYGDAARIVVKGLEFEIE